MRMQYIGVIDCNNFFVSCERLFRPDLIGKPVLVLSNNDGCVVARSQEIKDINIPMGVPAFQLKDMIKNVDVTIFSSHLSLYRDISQRVFSVVKDKLPLMEQYSIDEAFFNIESNSLSQLQEKCQLITIELERLVGIPVSIGIAGTKTQAKYANRLAKIATKPIILADSWWQKNAKTVRMQDIWGVGGQLLRRYHQVTINTVLDLYNCPRNRLDKLFGIAGLRLQAELLGQTMYPISPIKSAPKSVTSTKSFKDPIENILVLKDAIAYHVRVSTLSLREQQIIASKLQVVLQTSRYGDFVRHGGVVESILSLPTADTAIILKEAIRLLERLYEPGVSYKKAGVILSHLVLSAEQPASLFTPPTVPSNTILTKAIDAINARFGREKIQLGRHSLQGNWQSKHDNLSPSYTTRWSDLAVVR